MGQPAIVALDEQFLNLHKRTQPPMKPWIRWAALPGFILFCLVAGGLGSIATTPEIAGWYQTLSKPSWNPPSWVFGPVWSTLFVMMGVAAWLVWQQAGFWEKRVPLSLFGVQMVLNVAWSFIFFGMHQPGWAFVEIVALWLAIVATMASFYFHSKPACGLLAPYLAWVSFAGVLNFTIWQMNL